MDEIGKCAAIVEKSVEKIIAVVCFSSSFDIKHPAFSRAQRTVYLPLFGVRKHCKSTRYWSLRLLKVVTAKGLNPYHSDTCLETIF